MHKTTKIYPSSYQELCDLIEKFSEEERIMEEQRPFENQREELSWSGDKKMFVTVPKCAGDLIKEGSNLHHCVGTYVGSVKNNLTNIVFIRKKAEPEKSFYTVELDNNYKLVQIRGLQNKDPEENVKKFLNKYLEQLPPKN